MSEIKSKKTLIGSIHKSLDNATITGKLKLKNLFLLNIINKYLYACESELSFYQEQYLKNLVIALENTDKNICIYREQLSNYTNIVGCKNCTPLNANNVIVVNTPPEVDDTELEPVECISPTIESNTLSYGCGMSSLKILLPAFTTQAFFDFQGSPTDYKNLKITKLPEFGVLYYDSEEVVLNQVIDLTIFDQMVYIQLFPGEYDYFEFQISSVLYPDCYSNIVFKEISLCANSEPQLPVNTGIYNNIYNQNYS